MGRELRRVPLDFEWPLNKVWEGFMNPHYKRCSRDGIDCFDGYTAAGQWLESVSRLLALMQDESSTTEDYEAHRKRQRGVYPHPWLQDAYLSPTYPTTNTLLPLTLELRQLLEGLGGEGRSYFASSYSFTVSLRKAAGMPETWGICPVCEGSGQATEALEAYEKWEPLDPPEGPGYQLWETVSEGSPISPVFATEEEFVAYLQAQGYTEHAARAFCKVGWVPSGMIQDGQLTENLRSKVSELEASYDRLEASYDRLEKRLENLYLYGNPDSSYGNRRR